MSRASEWRLLERAGTLVAQLFFVAAGVYLGNRADAWKEERSHREAARATLLNFRDEIRRNRARLRTTHAVHAALRDDIAALNASGRPPKTTNEFAARVHLNGLSPSTFRHAAWQLALGNQSLTYLEPSLAFAIADLYENQESLARYGDITLQNVVSPTALGQNDPLPLARTLQAYTVDAATYQEPQILAAYDTLLPRIDSAITRLRN
ncbi:hypothetical protein tb265_33550 [Gemmatimonadetes bacterium T265]|nr:hypothetical protein tb265_33550 [Gemmatimonadetes bacterium T265]